jgi:GNAT superfamily N-acetyltransferase
MNELERIEAEAVREAVVLGGGRGELVGGAMCVAQPRVPIMELNRALVLDGAVDLDAIAAWFDGPYAVATRDAGVQRDLGQRGFEPGRTWMKFQRDAAPAPVVESDVRIEETTDKGLVGALVGNDPGSPMAAMVGAPGWRCFVGWADGEPAATGALYVDGTAAWIGVGFTHPDFRRRGAQSALLAARIEAARALGVTIMTTETGALHPDRPASSYNNILRAGFREAFLRPNWQSPG